MFDFGGRKHYSRNNARLLNENYLINNIVYRYAFIFQKYKNDVHKQDLNGNNGLQVKTSNKLYP